MILVNSKSAVMIGPEATTAGAMSGLKKVGCGTTEFKASLAIESKDLKESCSGLRAVIASFVTSTEMTLSLSMFQFSVDTFADAMYGDKVAITGSTVAGEVLGTVAVDDVIYTKRVNISALVIKDSAGAPATLVAGTDYVLEDAGFGRIKIVSIGSYVMPLTADYSYAASSNIKLLSKSTVIRSLVYEGTSAVDGTKMRVSLPRVQFSPTQDFNFISEEEASLTLEAKVLYSDIWAADPILGQFGKVEFL